MTRLEFFDSLREEQDRQREQAGYLEQARLRRTGPSLRRAPGSSLARYLGGFAAVIAVAAAVALWPRSPADSAGAMSFAVGDSGQREGAGAFVAAPRDSELPLKFDDGTRVALAAGTSARVARLDERGAHLVIEKGSAVAAVVHRPESRWRVDVGPFQVAVVGTRFGVSWDAGARVLELKLDEGAVLVSGGLLGEPLKVQAGQRLRAFADHPRVELSGPHEASEPAAVVPATPATTGPAPSAAVVRSGAPSSPAWVALAAAGKFREAVAAAEKAGFEAECARASGVDLLALGDAARLSGSAARAQQAYSAARAKLPGGGRSSYGLGLVAFDQRGDYAAAARHFEAYLREQPAGALRAEATGRLMESLQRAGRLAEARKLAAQYLSRYPKGAHAAQARKLAPGGDL